MCSKSIYAPKSQLTPGPQFHPEANLGGLPADRSTPRDWGRDRETSASLMRLIYGRNV